MKVVFIGLAGMLLMACNTADKQSTATGEAQTDAFVKEGQMAARDSAKSTTIQWLDAEVQNLGPITKGQVAEVSWKFKNTGNHPLYVTNVHAQCGCTTPDPPKEPIAPGQTGVIRAKFNSSNFSGHVTKEVYVEANNRNRNEGAVNKLTFTADIK